MESVIEQWRKIPGHPNYEASNLGRIRSLDRVIRWMTRWGTIGSRRHKGRILGLDVHHTGYLITKLGDATKQYRVHKLIAATWLGPCPKGMVVSHSDDNKWNCAASNLEYMTNGDNVKRSYRTGRLSNRGTTNGKAVLSDAIVLAIRALPPEMTAQEAADVLGLKKHNVHQVRRGAWSHVA